MSRVWKRVHKIAGKNTPKPPIGFKINEVTVADGAAVANILAKEFANVSRSSSRPNTVRQGLEHEASTMPDFSFYGTKSYNVSFKMRDLHTALNIQGNTFPGSYGITYALIKHLAEESLKLLLDIYNIICSINYIPDTWRSSVIIPHP